MNKLENEIRLAAKNYVEENQVIPIPFSGYQHYIDTGDRKRFENGYMQRRKQLAVLGMSCMLERNAASMAFLEKLIWEICNEYSWGVPAHLPIKNGQFTSGSRTCIDLFAAETGNALAEIKYHLGEHLSPMLKGRISEELDRRIFQPFIQEQWFWETSGNNWSSVIASSIGMAAMQEYKEKSEPQTRVLKKVDACLTVYLDSFSDDGACLEGIGYWSYGFGYYIYFADMYQRTFKNDLYLKNKKVKEIAKFPYRIELSEGLFVPFSDYTKTKPPTGLLSYCRDYFNISVPTFSEISSLDSDHCYRFAHIFRNVLWTKKQVSRDESLGKKHYFENAQWLIQQENNVVFAAKGGTNQESHNHNDVGHFVFGTTHKLFLTDLGAGLYTKEYFQESHRYSFLTNSSRGHSVPIINEEYQLPGSYSAKDVMVSEDSFKMSLENVYGKASQLQKYTRIFDLSNIKHKLEILDEYHFEQKNNLVVENYITLIKPQTVAEGILLESDGYGCVLSLDTSEINIQTEKYLNHAGKECTAYLIQGIYHVGESTKTKATLKLSPINKG